MLTLEGRWQSPPEGGIFLFLILSFYSLEADNTTVNNPLSPLKKVAIGLGLFIPLVLILLVLTFRYSGKKEETISFSSPQAKTVRSIRLNRISSLNNEEEEVADSEEEEEADSEKKTESEPKSRYITGKHRVLAGESISYIAGVHWDDIFLWPELYILNELISDDPDLIYIDEIVNIYNRLGQGNDYTEGETRHILDAYIEVYDRFKALGPQKNSSAWTLLWCGTKYDREFLSLYADRIEPQDMAMAEKYIVEEGYLD